jgi:adenylate kinase family enzyme
MLTLQGENPESRDIIHRGDMLPDALVGDLLLAALLINSCSAPECGVLVDGFPRTSLQVLLQPH